jgi:MscS family membrane protein
MFIAVSLIYKLKFPEAWQFNIFGITLMQLLHKVGVCILIFYFIWLVQSFIGFIALILETKANATAGRRDDQLIYFLRDFLKVIIFLVGVLLVLKFGFNQDIGAILTGLSIIGAALALAAKESIENLIASFIIFFDKPFFTGDVVVVKNVTGTVEHIGLRSTRIRTADKTLITVPNKQMVDSIVDNWSMRTNRRCEVKLEFLNSTSTEDLKKVMDGLNKFLDENKPPIESYNVYFSDFNKNGITITTEYFTIPFALEEFNKLKEKFNLRSKAIVEESGITMAAANNMINIIKTEPVDDTAANRPLI